jgi:hypothetical protein
MAKKQKPLASFSVKSVIFCDDIREEKMQPFFRSFPLAF